MKEILIADSGGSKTDWCFIDSEGRRSNFTTESYHPNNWGSQFQERITDFWSDKEEMKAAELHFFGSGCLNESNAHRLTNLLLGIGFQAVLVKSDLHGAALASLGDKNGWVAILGTGSVLFYWENGEIKDIIGGLGHLKGDEGSGYYFGKLILQYFKRNKLSNSQKEIIGSTIDKMEEVDKSRVSQLAYQTRDYQDLFSAIHLENIQLFLDTHFLEIDLNALSIVGSYGYYHQSMWIEKMEQLNVNVVSIIERPIDYLVEQLVGFIE